MTGSSTRHASAFIVLFTGLTLAFPALADSVKPVGDEEAAEALARAWRLVGVKSWSAAAHALDALLRDDETAGALIATQRGRWCIELRAELMNRLVRAPAPLLKALRDLRRIDAERLCEDPSKKTALRRAARCFPYLRAGARARISLAELALERGDLAAAWRHSRALEHPIYRVPAGDLEAITQALRRCESRPPSAASRRVMVWRLPYLNRLKGRAAPPPQVFEDSVYVYDGSALLAIDLISGRLRWRVAAPRSDPETGAERRLAVGPWSVILADRGVIMAFDRRDGQELWRRDFDRFRTARSGLASFRQIDEIRFAVDRFILAISEHRLVVERQDRPRLIPSGVVEALDPLSGQVLWRTKLGDFATSKEARTSLRCLNGAIFAASSAGVIAALDPRSGALRWLRQVRADQDAKPGWPRVSRRRGRLCLEMSAAASPLILDAGTGALRPAGLDHHRSAETGDRRVVTPSAVLVSTSDGLSAYGHPEPWPKQTPRTTRECIEALAARSYKIRAAALARLRALGEAALPALRRGSGSAEPNRAFAIALLLQEHKNETRLRAWRSRAPKSDFADNATLILGLLSPRAEERLTAFKALAKLPIEPWLVPIRRHLLGDSSAAVRSEVASTLARQGDMTALDELSRHIDWSTFRFLRKTPTIDIYSHTLRHQEALEDPRQVASLRRFLLRLAHNEHSTFADARTACRSMAYFAPLLGYSNLESVLEAVGGYEAILARYPERLAPIDVRVSARSEWEQMLRQAERSWDKGRADRAGKR